MSAVPSCRLYRHEKYFTCEFLADAKIFAKFFPLERQLIEIELVGFLSELMPSIESYTFYQEVHVSRAILFSDVLRTSSVLRVYRLS